MKIKSELAAISAAAVWMLLLVLEILVSNFWLGLGVFSGAYLLTCGALVWYFRNGHSLGPVSTIACLVPASLFAFALFGTLLDSLPLTPFPSHYPQFATFFGLILPSLLSSVAVAFVMLLPASLLFGRWNWLVPALAMLVWFLLDSETLHFSDPPTIAEQVLLFEQACFVLIVTFSLILLGPRVVRAVGGPAPAPAAAGVE